MTINEIEQLKKGTSKPQKKFSEDFTETTTELKPCPFCGSKHIRVWGIDKTQIMSPFVQCGSCLATTSVANTKKEAIKAWNMRAEKVEQLEKAIKFQKDFTEKMTVKEAIEVISQDIPCEYDIDLIEALNMATKSLEAWEKVIKEVQEYDDWMSEEIVDLIKKHLGEVTE